MVIDRVEAGLARIDQGRCEKAKTVRIDEQQGMVRTLHHDAARCGE